VEHQIFVIGHFHILGCSCLYLIKTLQWQQGHTQDPAHRGFFICIRSSVINFQGLLVLAELDINIA